MGKSVSPGVYRFAADVLLGLGFFALVTAGVVGTARLTHWVTGAAHAGGIIQIVDPAHLTKKTQQLQTVAFQIEPAMTHSDASQMVSFAILSGVFALMFAGNLAFFRHLKHAYRAPRAGLGQPSKWSRCPTKA